MRQQRIKVYLAPTTLGSICGSSRSNQQTSISDGGAIQLETVLLKDIEEINKWARLGFELHFRWFTLLLEVNAIAAAWLIYARNTSYSYSTLVCFALILLNLIGLLATGLLIKYVLDCNRRIQGVNERLSRFQPSKDPFYRPQSAVPQQAAKLIFGAAGFVMVLLLIVWAVVLGKL